ncbi:MAG: hypothetical protein V9F06_01820 [Thermomicrobiales bacterium]
MMLARSWQKWFDDRWSDRRSLDITDLLADIIDESWAREQTILPYHVYMKMVYHLSREAREGLASFQIPREFQSVLFEYQAAAVRIAAHHLNKRGGVMIGDVVGLGKTLMATALAKIFEQDSGVSTLIICPANLPTDVARLCEAIWIACRSHVVWQGGEGSREGSGALPTPDHRRESQPAQPRGQAATRRSVTTFRRAIAG